MVTNFENITHELTEKEIKKILPAVVRGLKTKKGEAQAITNVQMVAGLKSIGLKTTAPRLRRIINFIRVNNVIFNLVATSKGYYIANTKEDCLRFIESLDQRANAIITVRDALDYQLKQTILEDGK